METVVSVCLHYFGLHYQRTLLHIQLRPMQPSQSFVGESTQCQVLEPQNTVWLLCVHWQ